MSKVIAYDWRQDPIYDSDGEFYFKTEYGFVYDDPDELKEFMKETCGATHTIHEWLEHDWLEGERICGY